MPLRNRVDPMGALIAVSARGLFMGNRGGRIHNDDRSLGTRCWATRQWICCRLAFKGRRRQVWGAGYTELFFLDEPTAFAAGHRPCFECRRADAVAFAVAFGNGRRAAAPHIDQVLHGERLDGKARRLHRVRVGDLPDGAFVLMDGRPYALRSGMLLRWTPTGYADAQPARKDAAADVITPPSIVRALTHGYKPFWHPGARH